MIVKIYRKIVTVIATVYRKMKLKKLQEKYGFNDWHLFPVISKPYVKDIINYIAQDVSGGGYIVECGCGLGDIIGSHKLKKKRRIGVELSKEVCGAAMELHRDIKFINGTFDNIQNYNIDYLIAVNFVHEISGDEMKQIMKQLTNINRIYHVIVDEVTGNYEYTHNFDSIMPKGYYCEKIMGPYASDGGVRNIKVYTRDLRKIG